MADKSVSETLEQFVKEFERGSQFHMTSISYRNALARAVERRTAERCAEIATEELHTSLKDGGNDERCCPICWLCDGEIGNLNYMVDVHGKLHTKCFDRLYVPYGDKLAPTTGSAPAWPMPSSHNNPTDCIHCGAIGDDGEMSKHLPTCPLVEPGSAQTCPNCFYSLNACICGTSQVSSEGFTGEGKSKREDAPLSGAPPQERGIFAGIQEGSAQTAREFWDGWPGDDDEAIGACMQAYAHTFRERAEKAEARVSDLSEELKSVLRDWNSLVKASGSPTNGGAAGFVAIQRALAGEMAEALRALYPHCHELGMRGESSYEGAWLACEAVLKKYEDYTSRKL